MKMFFRQSPCVPEDSDVIVARNKMTIRDELGQTKYALENGYPVIVVPKEQRAVYMNLLASCDVDGMKKFFSKLMENIMTLTNIIN